MTEQKIILFYREREEYGYYSNFSRYIITVNDMIFKFNEQYIMYSKAILFGDLETAKKIMDSNNPTEVKRLGRTVKNFDQKIWNENVNKIADTCNYAKFTQHQNLKTLLLTTDNSIIAEASPYDKIWGIGIDKINGKDPKTWNGTNILGNSLMRVREIIRKTPQN